MKTELFTLCDSAQEYAGKCVIMGTFNEIKGDSFPTALQNISLVIRLAFDPDEDWHSTLTISAYNISDKEFPIVKFDTVITNKPTSNGQRSFVNALLKLDGIQIPKPGTYRFEVKLGDWSDNIELYASLNKI